MNKTILICTIAAALCGRLASAGSDADTERIILATERQIMNDWLKGNFDKLLEMSDPEITYFHAVTDKRLDGLPAVRELYEGYRGRPLFDSYEIIDPKVQVSGDTAILTYQLETRNGAVVRRWNATQVYRKKEGWRIIHAHWSMTKPPLSAAPKQ